VVLQWRSTWQCRAQWHRHCSLFSDATVFCGNSLFVGMHWAAPLPTLMHNPLVHVSLLLIFADMNSSNMKGCVMLVHCSATSIEFCGGTHLQHLGQAKAFALLTEEGECRRSQW
jgi:hypothetical protein